MSLIKRIACMISAQGCQIHVSTYAPVVVLAGTAAWGPGRTAAWARRGTPASPRAGSPAWAPARTSAAAAHPAGTAVGVPRAKSHVTSKVSLIYYREPLKGSSQVVRMRGEKIASSCLQ